jgi:multiple sugar transport system permease protein
MTALAAAARSLVPPRPRLGAALAGKVARYVGILGVTALWLFPVYFLVVTSLKTRAQILNPTPSFIFHATFDNYRAVFSKYGFGTPLLNSLIVAGATTVASLVLGSIAAYGLCRLEFKFRDDIAVWVLSLRMMPAVAAVLPYYILFQKTGLTDTRQGLVLVYLTFSLPFAIWLLRGFFADIPVALDEAAQLDGCGRIRTLFQVIIPVTKTGIAVTGIFVFIFAWNELLFALSLTDIRAVTVPVEIGKLVTPGEVLWGELSAGALVAVAPLFIVVFLLQRHIVRGLTLGAVK